MWMRVWGFIKMGGVFSRFYTSDVIGRVDRDLLGGPAVNVSRIEDSNMIRSQTWNISEKDREKNTKHQNWIYLKQRQLDLMSFSDLKDPFPTN